MQGVLRHICIFWNFKTFPQRSGIFMHVPGMYISSALTKRAHVMQRHDTNKVTCWTSRNLSFNAPPLFLRPSPVLSLLQELHVVPTRAHYSPMPSQDHETASEGVQVSMYFLVVIFPGTSSLCLKNSVWPSHPAVVTLALMTSAQLLPFPVLLVDCLISCNEVFSLDLCLSLCLALCSLCYAPCLGLGSCLSSILVLYIVRIYIKFLFLCFL